jgi:radical SAM superfamily enzyme YgiQ (UPF0313 family)
MVVVVPPPSSRTQVLLLHAPYPGTLKFRGVPSSLLSAAAPFVHGLAQRGELEVVGLFDPVAATSAYRDKLRELLSSSTLRALCISTSTAAIEETTWAVALARELRGDGLLVLVGGPHEDDCEEKVAQRLPGVDLSIGGEAEFVLARILKHYLESDVAPAEFVRTLEALLAAPGLSGGRVSLASSWWGKEVRFVDLRGIEARELVEPVWPASSVCFSVFDAPETLPVMVSRGCPYGRCSFCSEARRDGVLVRREFRWLEDLCALHPDAAIYFQDSIFPGGATTERELLPMLRTVKRPWGCQVYLPTLTRRFLERLAAHGCSYIYTGLESASAHILAEVGKVGLTESMALEKLRWARDLGVRVGISWMFGALSTDGRLLETEETVAATLRLAQNFVDAGVPVAGFYPNIFTVLPGTALARGLARAKGELDFYSLPKTEALAGFEDGAVGHNCLTLPFANPSSELVELILAAASDIQALGAHVW